MQGTLLRDAIISASGVLNAKKQSVDELNVFPVPDGDTGSNMSLTLSAAARELTLLENPTVSEVADTASSALLRGARGNSGVILSLLFRGFSKGLKGKEEATGADLAQALSLGVQMAYKAVMKPTEGTILTVSREASEKGLLVAESEDASENDVWAAICEEAQASLDRTPDILPVLKKAGVVDAGGQGFVIIINAMNDVFCGGAVVTDGAAEAPKKRRSAAAEADADIRFTYCTEFIVAREKGNPADPKKLRAFLESIGDCVVVVDDEEIIKVHCHTNDPGRALHEAIEYGQFETVKVENMRIQHKNAGWVQEADDSVTDEAAAPAEQVEEFGFVAVAAGDGIQALFTDLGCAHVVSGGQTMNPSTDDILQAVEQTPAKVVFVFPNNKNIILAAEQAIPLSDRKMYVLPSTNIPQGVSAMLSFDPDLPVEENLLTMTKAMENVASAAVTYAARDSEYDGYQIEEGQILALENGKLSFVDLDVKHAVIKLVRNMVAANKNASTVTLFCGEETTDELTEEITNGIHTRIREDIEVTAIPGGQPVYYYLIAVE